MDLLIYQILEFIPCLGKQILNFGPRVYSIIRAFLRSQISEQATHHYYFSLAFIGTLIYSITEWPLLFSFSSQSAPVPFSWNLQFLSPHMCSQPLITSNGEKTQTSSLLCSATSLVATPKSQSFQKTFFFLILLFLSKLAFISTFQHWMVPALLAWKSWSFSGFLYFKYHKSGLWSRTWKQLFCVLCPLSELFISVGNSYTVIPS
jgi:hypothetical protein